MTGVPAWQVRVEVPSHGDVIALAEYLAAQGWRVRRHPRSLIVSANCEDDAKGLGRALSGDGRADTDTAFRVGRVSYRYMYDESRLRVLRPTLRAGRLSHQLGYEVGEHAGTGRAQAGDR